jgi:hypothetical protein
MAIKYAAHGYQRPAGNMASAVKVKSGFRLAELDLDQRLANEASYLQKLRKLQIAMLGLEEIYRVDAAAPWYVVPADYKWFGRVAMTKAVVKGLGKRLASGPPPLDPEVVKAAAENLSRKEQLALGVPEPIHKNKKERA